LQTDTKGDFNFERYDRNMRWNVVQ